ncbi:MAG: PLP-dependent aminotransferase family protein [Chloroflexi bacterium]|nr:PLP-dependent aminotransferase family protein [Chloroflexota bacterium]MDL1883274.1 PLP-dependent aminotransferase family protein [Anaerolineae bacterium CFX8]
MFNPSKLAISLDREGEEPIYRQLIRYIRSQIESGELPAGTRLPASRDLAKQLNISRISVVNAYAELRAQGFLSAHAGRGTFIAGDSHGGGNGNGSAHAPETPTTPDRSIREMMRMTRKPGVINFSQGSPPADFYPVRHLRDAINAVLDRDGTRALGYEVAEGYAPLRAAVRDYISALGIRCSADQVLITGGTQQALDLVVQALLSENDTLVTENPTYLGMIDIARTRRVQVHGISLDEDGIRLDMLENFILDHHPKLIYVMPTFQNPTGTVMPLHRRRQLINLATEYKIPVLEDAVYHELRFEGEPLPPLKALDEEGIVIHASGFTKMMLPGIRIGYLVSDSAHYERLVRVKQAADIATSGLNQRAMHLMLERGVMAQQLERNNRELARRRDVALAAAARYLPPGSKWNLPQGGLYLWAQLPKNGPTAAELYVSAVHAGVSYAIGSVFYTNSCGSHRIRLNYGAFKPADIEEGFKRLGRAWRELACDYAEMEKSPLL